MKKILPAFFVILAVTAVVTCSPNKRTHGSHDLTSRIDSVVAGANDFSGVVLIAQKGHTVYEKAFGFRDFGSRAIMDTTTIFELASVSKQFTATLIMMLEEEGKLKLDDSLNLYVKNIPYPGITIRNLLNHTSGLPEYEKLMSDQWDKTKVAGNEDILEYLIRYHPQRNFKPGTKYEYNNTGYVLLGSIVEKVSGKDFVAVVNERIFKPSGMTNTNLRTPAEKQRLSDLAWGHVYVPEKKRIVRADSFPSSNYVFYLGNRKGPGRISSTAGDLLKWDRVLYTSALLKKESLEKMFTASGAAGKYDYDGYGFGWMTDHDDLGRKIRHGGDNPGYRTSILRYIDNDITVIVLCNNPDAKFKDLLRGIESVLEKAYRLS